MGLKNEAKKTNDKKTKRNNKIQIHIQNQHQHIAWKHKRGIAQTTNRQLSLYSNPNSLK